MSGILESHYFLLMHGQRHRELHLRENLKVNTRPRFAGYLDQRPSVSFEVRLGDFLILGSNAAVIGWDVVQGQIPAVDFVHKYENVFAFKSVILFFTLSNGDPRYCAVRHSSSI